MPADLRIPNNHSNQTMASKPTKPVLSTTSNSHQQRPHQKPSMKPNNNRPIKPQEPSRESDDGNQINQRRCEGECVSGLFALFCDGLDEEAYCANDATCCLTSENNNAPATTPRPVRFFDFNSIHLLTMEKINIWIENEKKNFVNLLILYTFPKNRLQHQNAPVIVC